MTSTQCVHGTAIVFGKNGVLIRGRPGAGKSTLALCLIDAPGFGIGNRLMRAKLIADDQVELALEEKAIRLSAPKNLAGLLEVRGHGLIKIPFAKSATLSLVVDLLPTGKIERMPEEQGQFTKILGRQIPRLTLPIADPAAPSRLRAVLRGL